MNIVIVVRIDSAQFDIPQFPIPKSYLYSNYQPSYRSHGNMG